MRECCGPIGLVEETKIEKIPVKVLEDASGEEKEVWTVQDGGGKGAIIVISGGQNTLFITK